MAGQVSWLFIRFRGCSLLLQPPGQQPGRDYTCEKIATRLLRTIISAVSYHLHTVPIKRRRDGVVARNETVQSVPHGVHTGCLESQRPETDANSRKKVIFRFCARFFSRSVLERIAVKLLFFLNRSVNFFDFNQLGRVGHGDRNGDGDGCKDNDSD